MSGIELNNEELNKVTGGAGLPELPKAYINQSVCIHCGICDSYCPTNAIIENGCEYTIDPLICIGPSCGSCLRGCPTEAISMQ